MWYCVRVGFFNYLLACVGFSSFVGGGGSVSKEGLGGGARKRGLEKGFWTWRVWEEGRTGRVGVFHRLGGFFYFADVIFLGGEVICCFTKLKGDWLFLEAG